MVEVWKKSLMSCFFTGGSWWGDPVPSSLQPSPNERGFLAGRMVALGLCVPEIHISSSGVTQMRCGTFCPVSISWGGGGDARGWLPALPGRGGGSRGHCPNGTCLPYPLGVALLKGHLAAEMLLWWPSVHPSFHLRELQSSGCRQRVDTEPDAAPGAAAG